MPSRVWMLAAGGTIGVLSSLFGSGGASISAPFLTRCVLQAVAVVGTAAALGLPIALAGTAGYVVAGMNAADLPPLSVGYVVLPAFGGIVIASMLFTPLGARLANRLRPITLRRLFAALLALFRSRLLRG